MAAPISAKKSLVDEKPNEVEFTQLAAALAELGKNLYRRGWALGTSGNFSAVLTRDPLRLAITATGLDKGLLSPKQIVQIDAGKNVVEGSLRPSDEAVLHLAVVRLCGAGAVLHTHSVWGTLLSDAYADQRGFWIEGYEMLKGLASVRTHEHREWLPILENSQDIASLEREIESTLQVYPNAHGFLLRRHGLYTWGQDLAQAKRHVEIMEFLLEVLGRAYGRAWT
jgi:methylthioribulose-1-phosphate dehydratase